jgi:hypothetical protein
MKTGHEPAKDDSPDLNAKGLQRHQEAIGTLQWAVETGQLDTLLEVALPLSRLALLWKGHLEQACHIFAHLKHGGKRRACLNPTCPSISEDRFALCDWTDFCRCAKEATPSNVPTPRGRRASLRCFVDSDHAGDKIMRRSHTGTLIFCISAPTLARSKQRSSVERWMHGSELVAMQRAIKLVKSLRCKSRMFGMPIRGQHRCLLRQQISAQERLETRVSAEQEATQRFLSLCREAVAAKIARVAKEDTRTNLSALFTKTMNKPRREVLLDSFTP